MTQVELEKQQIEMDQQKAEPEQPSMKRAPIKDTDRQPGSVQPIFRDGHMGYAWNIYEAGAGVPEGPINVNLDDGSISSIDDVSSDVIWMAAGDMAEDIWYVVSYDENNAGLYTVDPATGDYDLIGNTGYSMTGLAYDPAAGVMYASGYDGANSQLYTVDLTSGDATNVGQIASSIVIGIAADIDGNLYGISLDDNLLSIDSATGSGTVIGPLGVTINYAQDIGYDRDNDILYGTLYANSGGLYEIDTDTGSATLINDFVAEVAGFGIPYTVAEPDAPGEVADFTVTAGDEGALHADLSWDNPDETVDGEALTDLDAIHVYRDDALIHTIDDPVIGGAETYNDDDITEAGNYAYKVMGENDAGEGLAVMATVYIGEDVPAAPENIVLTADGNDGVLNWDAPTEGYFGGYFTGDNLTYTVVRFPCDEIVAEDITEEHYTDTEVPGIGNYYYTVTASNDIGEGGTGESNVLLLGAEDILIFETFEDEGVFPPVGWEYVNGVSDSYWEQSDIASYVGEFAARSYQGVSSDYQADEWLITPMIDTDDPNAQMLKFHGYSSMDPDGTRENMRILAVDEYFDNVNDLHDNATLLAVVPFEGDWTEHVVDISELSGDQHLIFHYYITAEDDASFNWIYIDNVQVGDFETFTLTMDEPDGEGSVMPEVGDHVYTEGDVVNLQASADMGWEFDHWIGDVEDENSAATTIEMDEDKTVKAVFEVFEAMELPFEEDFTGVPEGELPSNWYRDVDNWAVNGSDNAGGESPELRFHWSPSIEGEYYLTSPKINTEGETELQITFKHQVDNFSSPGPYTLSVLAIADDTEYVIHEWVDPGDIGPEEFEAILTADDHGIGSDDFYIAWVFDGDSYEINQWYIDDIYLGEAPDMYEVTFHLMEDSDDEAPIEGAGIHVDGEQITTDDSGMASIMLIDGQSYTANISASGYVGEEVDFTLDGSDIDIEVHLMDDISAPSSPEVITEGYDFGEAMFMWDTAELMHLYQHDGTVPAEPNAFYQEDDIVYGTIFDLEDYPDAEISHIDFHHMQWGLPDDDYDYLVHIVDWTNYDIIETKGPFTTEVNDDWEEDVMLSVNVAGYEQVGILIQPQGHQPDDAYPCLTTDATGPDGLSIQAPVSDLSDYTINPGTVGDFFIDLWVYTAQTKDKVVQAKGFVADNVSTQSTRQGEAVSSAETTSFTQHGAVASGSSKTFVGYNVFLNEDEIATEIEENHHLFTDLPAGEHTAGVQSVYTTGSSDIVEVDFMIEGEPEEVATLAELRDMPDDGTIYHYTGEAVIVAMDDHRNRKFLQDETAAIMIDDDPGIIETEYDLYDVITDVVGEISIYNNMVQFQPTEDAPEAIDNTPVDPVVFALDAVTPDDQAKLVRFDGVHFVGIEEDDVFENGSNYTISDGETEFVVRTDFWNVDYIDEPIPHTDVDIAGVIIQYQETLQLVPRFDDDIEEVVETHAVTFQADLTYAQMYGPLEDFDTENHNIMITGEMIGWTEPGDDPDNQMMEMVNDDPMTYAITHELEAGTYPYKYFSDYIGEGWAGGEWEGGDDRIVEVTGEMVVEDYFGYTDDEVATQSLDEVTFNIFPNPASDRITIESDVQINEIRMVDVLGQIVYTGTVNDTSHEITVGGMQAGVYFVQLTTEAGVVTHRVQVTR